MLQELKEAMMLAKYQRDILKTAMKPLKISASIKIRFRRAEKEQLRCTLSLPARYANGLTSKQLAEASSQLQAALDDLHQTAITALIKTR